MRLPDLSALKVLTHCPDEPDNFCSGRYHNRNAELKIIATVLKGLYLKDSIHSLQNQHRSTRQTEGALHGYYIHLGYLQDVFKTSDTDG